MKYSAISLALVLLLSLAASGFGHPPAKVSVEFDIADHLLRIVVAHNVADASKHYVDEIKVELNGRKIIEQKFKSQIDKGIQEASYRVIDARVGDKISVISGCSISGKKKAEIIVKAEEKEQNAESLDE
jgi:hypothetical protein